MLNAVLLVAGLVLLVGGGEALVRGGAGLGRALGLSPLVVGLTVVAFATSAPELAVAVDAVLTGAPGLAVGNVVGSNISNVLLVLGLAAVVLPVAVHRRLLRADLPVMIGLSVLLLVVALDGAVGRLEGLQLLALLVAYVSVSVVAARRADRADRADRAAEQRAGTGPAGGGRALRDVLLVVGGVALLVLGAHLLVEGATQIARALGVSDLVIGLTVVSVGTSLPEVATVVVAALRGEREMAVGNVVGSNTSNIGAVMGSAALVAPDGVPVDAVAVRFDLPAMVIASGALLVLALIGARITRGEGALFLGYYAAYVTYVVLDAVEHDALPVLRAAVLWGAAPLTVLAVALLGLREVRARRR